MEEGLQGVIVNPGIILGPGFWHQSSGKLIETSSKGNAFYTEGSSATIDAKDVVACMIQLTEEKHFGKRFVLTENNYSFKEILSETNKALGKKEPYINAGKSLLILAKWMDKFRCMFTGKDPVITKETITSGLEKNSFNNTRIKQTINYEFVPLKDTLKFVCDAFLKDIKK